VPARRSYLFFSIRRYADEHEYELAFDVLAASSLISADSHRYCRASQKRFAPRRKHSARCNDTACLKQGDAALSFYRLNPAEK